VAVLLVVITHTLGGPQGRTLGVDIFFVLSGFLITNVIVAELARRGTASLRRFYIRRMFRLFPALFVFLLAVLIWAQAFAPPILASRDTSRPVAGAAIVFRLSVASVHRRHPLLSIPRR
jgi:peptidoglycan/LPS O-acetylase OafA/YrhL